MTYTEWIDAYVLRMEGEVDYRCASATLEMATAFPELKRVRGGVSAIMRNAHLDARTSHPHWWLVTPDGTIVDPTAYQFVEPIEYDPLDENDPLNHPTGKCMGCGDLVYNGHYFCCEECEAAVRADMEI